MQDNSPQVCFFQFVNASGSATINFTLRANEGEDANAFYQRCMNFIKQVDPSADLKFMLKDQPRKSGGGGGFGGKKEQVAIKDNKFVITHVARVERANRQDASQPWIDFVAYGAQDGQEVSASVFFGKSNGWKATSASIVTNVTTFAGFMNWTLNERNPVPYGLIAHVSLNQYHRYDITSIESQIPI